MGDELDGRRSIRTAAEAVGDPRIRTLGLLLDTAARLERLLGGSLEQHSGLSHPMFEVLLRLVEQPEGATMGALSHRLVLTSGGATRLVDRMVEAGLVRRRRSAGDKRIQVVTITPAGEEALVRAAGRHADEIDRHVCAPLGEQRLASLVGALDRLGAHARAALPPLG